MATYSAGMTFAGGVNTSATAAGGGPVTIYTVPANNYFRGWLQPLQTGGGSFNIRINGTQIGTSWPDALSSVWFPAGTVFAVAAGGGAVEARIIGALFKAVEP